MNPAKFDRALREIGRHLRRERVVRAAILFGSVARESAGEDSDLDLLLILGNLRSEARLFDALQGIGAAHDVRVSVLCVDPSLSQLDRQMLDSIVRHGRPLKGRMPSVTLEALGLRPLRLIRYSLQGLRQREKVQLNRLLLGYRTTRKVGKKAYPFARRGLVQEVGGKSVARGAVLVPEEHALRVEEALRSHGAKRILVPVWMARP